MTFQATTAEIDFNSFQEEAETLLSEKEVEEIADGNFQNLFKIQTANSWIDEARSRPAPKMLFGEFWYEGELCILFADTGTGKSILSVQIGNGIAEGDLAGLFCCE